MIGESENVNVVASELELNPSAYHFMLVGNNVATIQNLVAVNWKLMVLMNFDNLSPGIFNITAAKMQNCWFETSYESHTQIYIEQSILLVSWPSPLKRTRAFKGAGPRDYPFYKEVDTIFI